MTSGDIAELGCSRAPCCFIDEEKAKQDPSYYLKNTNTETRETLQELYKAFQGDEVLAATMRVPEKTKVDKLNAVSRQRGVLLPPQPLSAPGDGTRMGALGPHRGGGLSWACLPVLWPKWPARSRCAGWMAA